MNKKSARRAEKLLRVGLYDLDNVLGKGNFAIVRLGVHKLTKSKVAVKIVDNIICSHSRLHFMHSENALSCCDGAKVRA